MPLVWNTELFPPPSPARLARVDPADYAVSLEDTEGAYSFADYKYHHPAELERDLYWLKVGGWLPSTGVAEEVSLGHDLYSDKTRVHMRWVFARLEMSPGLLSPATDSAGRPKVALLISPWRVGDTHGLKADFPLVDESHEWQVVTDWNEVGWGIDDYINDHRVGIRRRWQEIATVLVKLWAGKNTPMKTPWLKLVDGPVEGVIIETEGEGALEAEYREGGR